MSRIGRMPIALPAGVEVTIAGQHVAVKGPKGSLTLNVAEPIQVSQAAGVLTVARPNEERVTRSLHGLSRTLVANMVTGVTTGYTLTIDIVGVGMPGHFLCRTASQRELSFFDPFHSPSPLTADQCKRLYVNLTQMENWSAEFLEPSSARLMVIRVLSNLKSIYRRRSDIANLRWVMRLRSVIPEIAASESAKKANEINKSRKRKVVLAAAILLSLCFAAVGYYGPQNLWDTALRNPTKILLEKDWINSEYGVPAIVIETPEALERSLDVVLNSGEKSVQQFYYKHPKGVLFLDIETKMLVSDKAPDFNALTEQGLKNLESLGAKNIITKQENFEAQEGVKGIKTFGTADFALDGDKSLTKEDYILLYFGGKGFVQSIGMRWIDKDEYAEQISQKIMESIAFEKIALPQNPK